MVRVTDAELESSTLLQDNVKVRDINAMPPLFARLSETKPQQLDYVGVSYGLTDPLLKFWNRGAFTPVYLRQTANDLTGEHTTVMIRALNRSENDPSWLGSFSRDFHRRFLNLLSYEFRTFSSTTCLSIDQSALKGAVLDTSNPIQPLTKSQLDELFSPHDLKRLDSYADQMLDHHVILDMLPTIATLWFSGRTKHAIQLSRLQQSLLLALGLQRKSIDDLVKEYDTSASQLLGIFTKVIRKIATYFRGLVEGAAAEGMPDADVNDGDEAHDDVDGAAAFRALPLGDLEEELREGGVEAAEREKERERVREMIDANLERYVVTLSLLNLEDFANFRI